MKAIHTHIPSSSIPLPDDLLDIIESYLEKHLPLDDGDAQRLHEELLTIYQKEVKDQPGRFPAFLAILRQLRPAIGGHKRLLQWWDLLVIPVLDHLGNEKGLVNETRLILLEILAFDTDDESAKADAERTSSVLTGRLLALWLEKSGMPNADAATKFLHQQIHTVLMDYGRKRPKDFVAVMNKFFLQSKYRSQILSLLGEFIRYGPPHLYQLLQTPLWPSLLHCLQKDTSTTVVSLAMTVLIMLLPHMPNSVRPHLPELFKIYARLLFWERERGTSIAEPLSDENHDNTDVNEDASWEKIHYSSEFDADTIPELRTLFTFLYGLYPINFMSFIRKPERYLRHANYDDTDDMDVQPSEVRERSESFRRVHLLHPNFFQMTLKAEMNDPNRWKHSEAADVTAACMMLYCGPSTEHEMSAATTSEILKLSDGSDQAGGLASTTETVGASDVATSIDSTKVDDVATNQAALSSQINEDDPSSETIEHSVRRHGQAMSKDNTQVSQVDFTPTQTTEYPVGIEQIEENSSVAHAGSQLTQLTPEKLDGSAEVMALHREIMMLKNDLNFERYLKQQHLTHIGQLRTRKVREATVEAETQNLINVNRGLKSKLEEAKSNTAQIKREAEKSRSHAKKWEADLTAKLRSLKEEQKKWLLESEDLNRQLNIARDNNDNMRKMIVASEARELASQQKLQSSETDFEALKRVQEENESLKTTIRTLEAREVAFDDAKLQTTLAESKIESLQLKLAAQATEMLNMRADNERQLEELRLQLDSVRAETIKDQGSKIQPMIDAALSALRARLAETQRAHSHLLKRFTNLEASYIALKETQQEPDAPLLGGTTYFDSNHTTPTGTHTGKSVMWGSNSMPGTPGTPGSDVRRVVQESARTSSFDSQTGTGSDVEPKDRHKVRLEDVRMYGRGEFDLSSIRGRGMLFSGSAIAKMMMTY